MVLVVKIVKKIMADSGIVLVIKIGQNVKWEFESEWWLLQKSEFEVKKEKKVKSKRFE